MIKMPGNFSFRAAETDFSFGGSRDTMFEKAAAKGGGNFGKHGKEQ